MKADKDKIKEVEAALTAKNIVKDDYAEIHRLLKEYKDAEDRIEEEQGEQYYEDAFKATRGMGLTRAMIVQVARYLSKFAERITSETIEKERVNDAIEDTDDKDKKE